MHTVDDLMADASLNSRPISNIWGAKMMKATFSVFFMLGVLAFSGVFAVADLIEVMVEDDAGGL